MEFFKIEQNDEYAEVRIDIPNLYDGFKMKVIKTMAEFNRIPEKVLDDSLSRIFKRDVFTINNSNEVFVTTRNFFDVAHQFNTLEEAYHFYRYCFILPIPNETNITLSVGIPFDLIKEVKNHCNISEIGGYHDSSDSKLFNLNNFIYIQDSNGGSGYLKESLEIALKISSIWKNKPKLKKR